MTELSSEYIDFISYNTESGSGLYTAKIRFVKNVQDAVCIVIKPVCKYIPRVTDIKPKMESAGCDQDSTITITFNKSVDTNTFVQILDFTNLTITDEYGTSLASFYGTPYFSNNDTILNIPTVKGKPILDPQTTAEGVTKTVTITLNLTGTKDTDGMEIESCEPHTYRVNKKQDTRTPEISEAHIWSGRDRDDFFFRELTDKPFLKWNGTNWSYNWDPDDYNTNHVGRLYIDLSGFDRESGIQRACVKEIYERTTENLEAETKTEEETSYSEFIVQTDGSGETSCTFSIDQEFKSVEDGVYRIELSLFDNAGNESEKKVYYVIKDSVISIKNQLNMESKYRNLDNPIFPTYNSATERYEADLNLSYFELSGYSPYRRPYNGYTTFLVTKMLVSLEIRREGEPWTKILENQIATNGMNFLNYLSDYKIDPAVNTYFKIKIRDERGFSDEHEVFIPRWTQVIDVSEFSYQYDSSFTATAITMTPLSPATDTTNFYCRKQGTQALTAIKNERDANLEYTLPPIKSRYFNTAGIYEIYALSSYKTKETVTGNGYNVCGAFGKPFLYYNNVTPPSSTGTALPSLILDRDNIVYERNTAKAKIRASISGNVNSAYTYIINANKKNVAGSQTSFAISSETTLELDNGYEWEITLSALDENGVKLNTSSAKQTLNLKSTDNIPPVMAIYYAQSEANVIRALFNDDTQYRKLHDLNASLAELQNIQFVEYYFVPQYIAQYIATSGTLDAVKSNCVKRGRAEIDYDKEYFEISNAGLTKNNDYMLYLYAEDNSPLRNYTLISSEYSYTLKNIQPSADESTTENLKITNLPEKINGNHYNYIYIHYLEDNIWNGETLQGTGSTGSGADNYYQKSYADLPASNKFIKVDVNNHIVNRKYDEDNYFLKPLYVYPEYYQKRGTSNEIKCRSKGIMPLTNGYQVFCDKPCFVHTMYAATLISRGNGMNDTQYAGEWEQRAAETGLFENYEGTMFTYTNDNLDEIPKDYWYVTIAHFADGTVVLSDVKQK